MICFTSLNVSYNPGGLEFTTGAEMKNLGKMVDMNIVALDFKKDGAMAVTFAQVQL